MEYICTGSFRKIMVWDFLSTRNDMNRKPANFQFLDFCLVFAPFIFFLAKAAHKGRRISCKVNDWQKGLFLSLVLSPFVSMSRQFEYTDCLIVASCKMWQRVLYALIFSSQVPESCLFLAQSITGSWLSVREYMYACTCWKWFQLTQGFHRQINITSIQHWPLCQWIDSKT